MLQAPSLKPFSIFLILFTFGGLSFQTILSRADETNLAYRATQTTRGVSLGIGGGAHTAGGGTFSSAVRIDRSQVAGEIFMHAGASMLRIRGGMDFIPIQLHLRPDTRDPNPNTRFNLEMIVTAQGAGDLVAPSTQDTSAPVTPTYLYVGPEVAASLIHTSGGLIGSYSRGGTQGRGLFVAVARLSTGTVGGVEVQRQEVQALLGVTARVEGRVMMSLNCESTSHTEECHAIYLRGSSRITQNLLQLENGALLQNSAALGYEYTMEGWGPGTENCSATGSCRFSIFGELGVSHDLTLDPASNPAAPSNTFIGGTAGIRF
jgi:hypothetical protein